MTHKFQTNYGSSRLVKLACILILLSNLGGFCLGYIIGERNKERQLRQKNFIIEKLPITIEKVS
jgi:uncharacterized protein YneF (UPF0154 family)